MTGAMKVLAIGTHWTSRNTLDQKMELLRLHRSQLVRPHHPFDLDTVTAQARFAEGLCSDRFLVDLGPWAGRVPLERSGSLAGTAPGAP